MKEKNLYYNLTVITPVARNEFFLFKWFLSNDFSNVHKNGNIFAFCSPSDLLISFSKVGLFFPQKAEMEHISIFSMEQWLWAIEGDYITRLRRILNVREQAFLLSHFGRLINFIYICIFMYVLDTHRQNLRLQANDFQS